MTCPKCGWSDVRVSQHHHFLDYLLGLIALAPLRCRKCRLRFYRPWFLLDPASQKPEVVTRTLPQSSEPPRPSVLLVDADAAVRRLLEKLLSREGFTVLQAAGPREAIAELRAHHVDAVLANLDEKEQPCVIAAWQSARPEVSVITLSCTARVKAVAEGKLLTLPRPLRPSAVIKGVQQMLKAG